MRWFLPLVLVACSHAAPPPPAPAATPSRAGESPAIELDAAVGAARTYAQQHAVDLSRSYLRAAVFDAAARHWRIEWQVPNAKGGQTIFDVAESGAITVGYGE